MTVSQIHHRRACHAKYNTSLNKQYVTWKLRTEHDYAVEAKWTIVF